MSERKTLVSIGGLVYFIGERQLLDIPELAILEGDHIGVVGENGCGKTTLLDLIAGVRQPESGWVERRCPLAYCRQLEAADPVQMTGPLTALGAGPLARQAGRPASSWLPPWRRARPSFSATSPPPTWMNGDRRKSAAGWQR